MNDYEFELPFPPSVNGMWKPFKSRLIICKRGRDYRAKAIEVMQSLGLFGEMTSDRLTMTIELYPPTLRRYDVDNFSKAILDALTHSKFWEDDEQVMKLTVEKKHKTAGGKAVIKISVI